MLHTRFPCANGTWGASRAFVPKSVPVFSKAACTSSEPPLTYWHMAFNCPALSLCTCLLCGNCNSPATSAAGAKPVTKILALLVFFVCRAVQFLVLRKACLNLLPCVGFQIFLLLKSTSAPSLLAVRAGLSKRSGRAWHTMRASACEDETTAAFGFEKIILRAPSAKPFADFIHSDVPDFPCFPAASL